ncbi:GntR family transcriptional regulator [Bordetella pertussis]|uniref:GntR family regulatory protein n=2 Tax=Bordetella pertussis TaxID=520 RepID=Q7VTI9_BORPE|nr:GntR family regulatory protein [Bordetella pertussis CS]AIW93553.1 GntR family transcriptional regulator [Bordetella pertussis B1917]AIW94522.1 GntR family transcriptional regulator [Bordetella pertussis B1920]AJB25381.1 GntR family transcriptional regulator [Bordetella pertussis 137]ALH50604.1 GntR family transcriptional regulator [Bordetella pertussis]CAE43806.1 GntR family regulatory protein [Bordetella pertussis Tohama I]CCJ64137.1 GntR family regulatory protein [Bordetella pertussis 1
MILARGAPRDDVRWRNRSDQSGVPVARKQESAKSAAVDADGGVALHLERGQRVRLADQLYGQIFDQIASGRLNVGDKLPSEHEICEKFGVSRPVVREALLRLRADGLVTAHQGLGTFVSHQPAPRLKTFSDVQNVGAYLRAQEVRVALEGDAARLAALRRTDEQLHKIGEAHAAFVEELEHGRVSPEADLAFHASIAEASGNDFYLGVLETIHESISGFMRLTLSLTRTGSRQRAQRVADEHAAILGAIREQDAERARIAMQFHLGQARHRLVDRDKD